MRELIFFEVTRKIMQCMRLCNSCVGGLALSHYETFKKS